MNREKQKAKWIFNKLIWALFLSNDVVAKDSQETLLGSLVNTYEKTSIFPIRKWDILLVKLKL